MTSGTWRPLEAEISRFRAWADRYPKEKRSGEWECDYEEWPRLYGAFTAFVTSTPCQHWDEVMVNDILFAVARDNEIGQLLHEVRENLNNFLCLAEHAFTSSEKYAKSQIVAELGRITPSSHQIEAMLWQFAHDVDEYVRRLAMSGLADIGSPNAIKLVGPAWETGNEQQRMAVLYALWKIRSPLLEDYLLRAETDGRPYLLDYAAQVREGNPK